MTCVKLSGLGNWLKAKLHGALLAGLAGVALIPGQAVALGPTLTAFGQAISLPATTPVGTILARYYISPQQICGATSCAMTNASLFPYGGIDQAPGPLIETNVSGISTQFLVNGKPMSNGGMRADISSIEVQLVRDARAVKNGSLAGTASSPGYVSFCKSQSPGTLCYGGAAQTLLVILLSGGVTAIQGTCQVPDQTFTLPVGLLKKLTGIGTTTGSMSVRIPVNSCPAGYNAVNYSLFPVGIANANNPGVLPSGSGSTAKGVAIKLTDAQNAPVTFDKPVKLAAYNKATGGSYSIPLTASYVQTETSTVAGKLVGAMQVLLDYN